MSGAIFIRTNGSDASCVGPKVASGPRLEAERRSHTQDKSHDDPHRYLRLALRTVARRLLPGRPAAAARARIRVAACCRRSRSTARSIRCSRPSQLRRVVRADARGLRLRVKGGRYITHMLRLKDVDTRARQLLRVGAVQPAGEARPDPVAVPAAVPLRRRALRRVLRAAAARHRTPRSRSRAAAMRDEGPAPARASTAARPLRHAVEIRHPSFVDPAFVALLRRHDIALVVADTAGKLADTRGCDGGLRLRAAARRQGAVRERLYG